MVDSGPASRPSGHASLELLCLPHPGGRGEIRPRAICGRAVQRERWAKPIALQRLDSRGKAMTATEGLRYIDSDGHILEHPTAMPEYAPAQWRDRIWHVETDEAGEEWLLYNNHRSPANTMSAAGVAGARDEVGRARSAARCATPRRDRRRGTPRRVSRT